MHERIKEFRLKAGLTQHQLAERMGVLQTTVSMWETGQGKPRTDKLPQLARILGCTIDELYGEEEKEA